MIPKLLVRHFGEPTDALTLQVRSTRWCTGRETRLRLGASESTQTETIVARSAGSYRKAVLLLLGSQPSRWL